MLKIIFITANHSINYYLLEKLDKQILAPYLNMSSLGYRLRYLSHRFGLYINRLNKLNPEIFELDPDVIFILESSLYYIESIAEIRQVCPKARLIYLYSNIVKPRSYIDPNLLDQFDCEKYSWDKNDCLKYGMNHLKPFYVDSLVLSSDIPFMYDAIFIGMDKGRYSLLKRIEAYLNAYGMRTYFHIVADNIFSRYKRIDYKRQISYDRYLEYMNSSKCIIDIVQDGQCGTTMRTFEAIFNNRKLITNNKSIKDYDFYNANNIFILDESNLDERLLDFMDMPIIPITNEVINAYNFDSWLRQFNLF